MPRIKNIVEGVSPEELANATPEGGARYAGKKPPKGLYKGRVRFLALRGKKQGNKFVPQKNRNGDYMIRGAVSVLEKGPKEKYNGYLINFNQNISRQGAPFVNQMLDSMFGGNAKVRREFWDKNIFVAIDNDGKITHVGKSRYTDNSIEVVVSAKDANGPNDTTVLEVAAWLLPTAADPDDGDDDTDEETEDGEESEDEDISFDEDEAEEDVDGEADEDDEPDDEPDEAEDDADDDADGEDEDAEPEDEGSDDGEEEGEGDDEEFDSEARLVELKAMSRDELKALLKSKDSDAKVMKSDTVDSLAGKIIDLEAGVPPF